MSKKGTIQKLLLTIVAIIGVGCTVGPNFERPKGPAVHEYTEEKAKEKNNPYFDYAKPVSEKWWTTFGSDTINLLVETGLQNSPDIQAASAVLKQAEENLIASAGEKYYPSVDAEFSVQREKFSAAAFGAPQSPTSLFNLFNPKLNVSYTFDLFGKNRREIEDLCAQVDYQRFQLEAAHLTLAANIATTAISQASYVGQIYATKELIKAQEEQLVILEKQYDLGAGSYQSVLLQRTLVEQTRSQLYTLEQSLAQTRHLLATLVGKFPSENGFPNVLLNELKVPEKIPVSLPSQLVQQRPDIQAAQAVMHQATAQVGVAIANFFPQINLTGSYGWESNHLGNLFSPQSNVWSIGADILQPVWKAGSLIHRKRQAVAVLEQAKANYQKTVLAAFAQVADAMKAIGHDDLALKSQIAAEKAAKESLVLAEKQFQMGAVDFLTLLIAQRAYQGVLISRIQAQATRTNDVAALFQALGGGWGNCGVEVNG